MKNMSDLETSSPVNPSREAMNMRHLESRKFVHKAQFKT